MSAEAPLERVTDDSVSSIVSDMHEQWQGQQTPEAAATQIESPPAVEEPAKTEQAQEAEQGQEATATENKTAEIAPAPPDDSSSAPTPESRLAPIFELASLPMSQAVPQAVGVMKDFYSYDPIAYSVFANAVLQASPQSAAKLVLEANGIPKEKVEEFSSWLSRGGDALPDPIEYPAFEKTVVALESEEGSQLVRLANGVELDLADPRDKAYFEQEKRLYDWDVKDKVKAREEAVERQKLTDQQKQDEAAEQRQVLMERADFYTQGRYGVVDEVIEKAVTPLATTDKLRADMFKVYARHYIDNHPEIQKLGQQATPYVQQGHGFEKGLDGQWKMGGRAAELATAQDRIIKRELNTLIDQFNKDILRTNRAEIAATATQPQIPPNARTVEATAPDAPGLNGLNSISDILAAAREADRQSAKAGN